MNDNKAPFDLQKALKGYPVITRGGELVTIAAVNSRVPIYARLVGWIGQRLMLWRMDGRTLENEESSSDLFMKTDCDPKKDCCGCTCNRSVCLTDPWSGSLETRSTQFVASFDETDRPGVGGTIFKVTLNQWP